MTESASPDLDETALPTPALPDRADAPVSETAERFLRGILAQVPVERIEELHLFSPLRQGTIETGIAVLAARAPAPEAQVESNDPEFLLEEPIAEGHVEDAAVEIAEETPAAPPVERHTVFTARYRYIIKGPERGKWEADIKAEADAPLITVETVVRGVQRRAGEESEIVRYTGTQIAKALRLPMAPEQGATDGA